VRILDTLPPPTPLAGSADPLKVAEILADVRQRGDAAVREWTRRLDRCELPSLQVPREVLREAWERLPPADQHALEHAARNIRTFAQAQRTHVQAFRLEIEPGVWVGQRLEPVERVACYVPGGRYPLPSTVLMTVIPAVVAGVPEVVVLTPPGENALPNRYILAAAHLAGASAVHPVGGVQAIGAAAYGTESIAAAPLIVGPGNAWVTEAKRQVFGTVGIDALAGPSEVMVLLDDSADLTKVAADLLAQAEHDPDAEAIAVTDDRAVAEALVAEVARQLQTLPTREVAAKALQSHGIVVVVADRAAMVAVANQRAPEHLEVCTRDASDLAAQCRAFGGLFIGGEAAEVLGDYCAGPSHVLPTGRAGRYTGGLGLHTFVRVLTFQEAAPGAASALAKTAAHLARLEGLEAHARAADLRIS
jgi:sulfopropanediol 3-dehydrogenase